jgi:hypothetical protein
MAKGKVQKTAGAVVGGAQGMPTTAPKQPTLKSKSGWGPQTVLRGKKSK